MRALKHKKDIDREATLNQSFHFEIYRCCGSAVLIPMIESLWLQSGPCIRVAIYAFSEAGEVDTAHYHRSIVAALAKQDAQAAREALVADISRPFAFLRDKLQSAAAKDARHDEARHQDHRATLKAFRDGAAAAGKGARECCLSSGVSRAAARRRRHPCDVDRAGNLLSGSRCRSRGPGLCQAVAGRERDADAAARRHRAVLCAAAHVGRQSECDLRHRPVLRAGRAPAVPDRLARRQRGGAGASPRSATSSPPPAA